MNENHEPDLDAVLDAALPGYSSAEPMAGLEARVLRRIHADKPARRTRTFGYLVALSAAAAVLIAVIVVRQSQPVALPKPEPPVVEALQHPPKAEPAPRAAATQSTTVKKVKRRNTLPKQDKFPAPAPVTPEEQALIRWARLAPTEAREAFASLRARADEPLAISPIQIQPLQNDGAQ